MGGTFDILHKGHVALLTQASEIGKIVLIGLTTDERARKYRKNTEINSYKIREKSKLKELFLQKDNQVRTSLYCINEPFMCCCCLHQ